MSDIKKYRNRETEEFVDEETSTTEPNQKSLQVPGFITHETEEKKFYLSSTDERDDDDERGEKYRQDSEATTTTTTATTENVVQKEAISKRKSKNGEEIKESLPKVPTAVILSCADEKIRKARAGNYSSSSTLAAFNSRSISEVLRAKLSALPIREEGNFTLGCSKVFHTRTRFLIMILCLLCLASIWSNILCFNFAIICIDESGAAEHHSDEMLKNDSIVKLMSLKNDTNNERFDNDHDDRNSTTNGTLKTHQNKFSNQEQLIATSAAALFANFAVVSLVNIYGIRLTFFVLGILSSISTCLLPMAIGLGFYYVLLARVFQGIAFAANFPVIGAFTSKWTYYKQNGLFVSVLVAYVQFAPAVTMPISGAICSSIGWPFVFYVHGFAGAVLFVIFISFFRNTPGKHPYVGEVELRKIAVGKSERSKELMKNVPIIEILKTPSVWAIWIAATGNFVCVNMMFLYSPVYLSAILKFPVAHAGVSASLAPLAQFSIKLFAGFTSDKIRFLSETNKLRLYNSIAFFGSSIFLTFLAFFPTEFSTICVALLGISAGLLGFTTGGFFKAGPLVAKHYSLIVMGQISLAITVTLLIVPAMVSFLAPDNTVEGWRRIFLCTAAVLCLTNLVFCLMTSAKPAYWTMEDFSQSPSQNKIYSTDASVCHQQQQQASNVTGKTIQIKEFSTTIVQ